ncbi:MAG: RnfH family protein [Gammaproteobacteria bacterium]|nr:RnfH family protein [Gammaproteobacteria bacterium]
MAANSTSLHIEVAYAQARQVHVIPLRVTADTSIRLAIQNSGILERCPEIDLAVNKIGVFSKLRDLDSVVRDGDRIEIYRPLIADPKDARRARAARQKTAKT